MDAGPVLGPADAAPPATRSRVTTPAGEFHLDDSETAYRPQRRRSSAREQRIIEITLKSTPSGAIAAVDGVSVGPTPTLWEGEVSGTPREFTFVLPGYAMARYRFVPTANGIVHGTLKKLPSELPDAGVPGPIAPAE